MKQSAQNNTVDLMASKVDDGISSTTEMAEASFGEEAKKAYEKVSKSKRNFFAEDHRVETSVAALPPRRTLKRSLSMNDALTKHGPHAVSEIT